MAAPTSPLPQILFLLGPILSLGAGALLRRRCPNGSARTVGTVLLWAGAALTAALTAVIVYALVWTSHTNILI